MFTLKNLPLNSRLNMIIDIKEYNVAQRTIINYGWTVYPIFEDLDVDDDPNTTELFLSSGLFNLPLFKGDVIDWIVKELNNQDYPWAYLMSLINDPTSGLEFFTPKSVILKVVDNQRRNHFTSEVFEVD
jgi:hypothetical protein